jgi:hypothetical protein
MTDRDMLEARMDRQEQRADRMYETVATKEDIRLLHGDIKLLHDRLNNLTVLVVGVGFLNIVVVITVRLLF